MKIRFGDINVYYLHDKITPGSIRHAVIGNSNASTLIPETGDVINDFAGWLGEPITVRVVNVKQIGHGVEAYEVTVTDFVPEEPVP